MLEKKKACIHRRAVRANDLFGAHRTSPSLCSTHARITRSQQHDRAFSNERDGVLSILKPLRVTTKNAVHSTRPLTADEGAVVVVSRALKK